MKEFFDNVIQLFMSIRINDIVDIFIIGLAIFMLLKSTKGSKVRLLFKGIILFGLAYLIANLLQLTVTVFIFQKLFVNVILVLLILFRPELRKMIETMGRGKIKDLPFFKFSKNYNIRITNENISSIVNACKKMSEDKVGALIVVEGEDNVTNILQIKNEIDSTISSALIENVFYPKAPLHDGAMIIKNGRIHSAGAILPLTAREINRSLGTRHRAGIGLSENCDALVIIVSEETGKVSVASKGTLTRDLTSGRLIEKLTRHLLPGITDESSSKKGGENNG